MAGQEQWIVKRVEKWPIDHFIYEIRSLFNNL